MRFRYASMTDMSAQKARRVSPDRTAPSASLRAGLGGCLHAIANPAALPAPSLVLPLSALWLNQTQVSPTPAVCSEELNAWLNLPWPRAGSLVSAHGEIYDAALA